MVGSADESVSFMGVLSTSVAVKSRRKEGGKQPKPKPAQKVEEDAEEAIDDNEDDGEDAFVFYKPKKGT